MPGRAGSLCREYIDIEGRVNDQTPTELAQDGIEQGKRLIRLSGDKGLSLSERVANHFYRLTWRTPLHAMRLKGKYPLRSEEHTSELQSLMRISYADFCLKKKNNITTANKRKKCK